MKGSICRKVETEPPDGDSVSVGGSGEDAGDGGVEFTCVVEDPLGKVVHGPIDRGEVGLHAVAESGEHLIPVAGGIEEVDRRPSGDAVPGGSDVDRHVIHAENVTGPQDGIPIFHVISKVVQLVIRALDHGEVVRGFTAGHPGADHRWVFHTLDHSLGRLEIQHLIHESFDQSGILSRDQRMIDPVRADPPHMAWPCLRVDRSGFRTAELHVGVELESLFGRQGDAHRLADLQILAGTDPAGGGPELLGAFLENGQVIGAFNFLAELDQANSTFLQH